MAGIYTDRFLGYLLVMMAIDTVIASLPGGIFQYKAKRYTQSYLLIHQGSVKERWAFLL
jgi:hypothetical protein